MVARNVALTETQDQPIHALVASGRHQNASEAMRTGLRLLEREEAQLAGLRQVECGDLAKGSGEEAVRRAFARARVGS